MPESSPVRRRLFDLTLWVLLSVPVLLRSDPADGGSWLQVAVGVTVLGGCVAVSRRWPLLPLAVTVAASLPASLELFTPSYSLALVAFGYLAGRRQDHARGSLWLFGAVAAVGLLLTRLTGTSLGPWFALLLALALAIVAPWLVGRYVRQYDRLVRSGWELADRMEREQAAVADRERLRERSRIAGDMHDSLGHDLALIAVRAGVLEVDPGLGPEQQRAAGDLRRAAAAATERLRDVIGVLREEGARAPTTPPDETVAELVDRARASGLDVTLSAAVPEPPGMTGRALHRVVQEGLTNAAKHAPGAAVTVGLRETASRVTVRVVSGPGTGSGPPASGGSGLVGLDERVRLAGGTLAHGPLPGGGFALTAVLPRRPPVPVPPAPTSARELDRARRRVRADLVRAIWIPLALLAALAVLTAGVAVWSQSRSYLEPDNYARLLVGQAYAEIAEDLPDHALETPPKGLGAEPGGTDECRYYRTTVFAELPVYRLCFVAGRLVHKAELP
ncbi:sensor histidine kinase [Streptomyces filamentosus]|uniref:histidine kinase n=1 Tax=Streptomyces filamentosus TaxID=67294 RepID=A0A919EHN5_STRFL|nr:histidine kinase [Streptomyces filamentosus]GHF84459.1 two-component sensor histidine kinase [Streptomyces filamentosus]